MWLDISVSLYSLEPKQTQQMILGKQMLLVSLFTIAHLLYLDDRFSEVIFILILCLQYYCYTRDSALHGTWRQCNFLVVFVVFFLSLFTTHDSKQQFHLNDILYFVSHFCSSTWWGMWRAARKTSTGTPAAKRRLGIHEWVSETMGITIFLQGMAVLEDAWCLS